MDYSVFDEVFGTNVTSKVNVCLEESPIEFVWHENDAKKKSPEEIAERLEACGL